MGIDRFIVLTCLVCWGTAVWGVAAFEREAAVKPVNLILEVEPSKADPVLLQAQAEGYSVHPLDLPGVYALHPSTQQTHRQRRAVSKLAQLPGVLALESDPERLVSLRQFTDPLWLTGNMSYWSSNSIIPATRDLEAVWRKWSGRGVTIGVSDDGVDIYHPDLANYDATHSYNHVYNRSSPRPRIGDTHGTRVAGLALGAHNTDCGFGMASNATLYALRVLAGVSITTEREVNALLRGDRYRTMDILVQAWGYTDDGASTEKLNPQTEKAMKKAANEGRGGLGTLVVVAGGNGGGFGDDCMKDGYANQADQVITVQSILPDGRAPYYAEHCTAAMTSAVVPNGMVTTNPTGLSKQPDCIGFFAGTSAAAPIVGGILALALQANPSIHRLQMLDLIRRASDTANIDPNDAKWIDNGYNKYSPTFGFGMLNANRLLRLAEDLVSFGNSSAIVQEIVEVVKGTSVFSNKMTATMSGKNIAVNIVRIKFSLKSNYNGDVELFIYSPGGTKMPIFRKRLWDNSSKELQNWELSTPGFWGEPSAGTWIVSAIGTRRSGTPQLSGVEMTIKSFDPVLSNNNEYGDDNIIKKPWFWLMLVVIILFVGGGVVVVAVFARRRLKRRKSVTTVDQKTANHQAKDTAASSVPRPQPPATVTLYSNQQTRY